MGSKPYFFTKGAPNIWAPIRKYGSTEFSRDMNHIASAWQLIPVTLFGKRIVGRSTLDLMAFTTSFSWFSETKVEPPIIIAAVPLFLELSAILEASEVETFSGSMRVMWIEPSVFIFSSKYLSIGPSMVSFNYSFLTLVTGD